MSYADDITITSTHTSTSYAKTYIYRYLHKVFAWTKQNNLTLNPDKTTYTLFTPDLVEYTSNPLASSTSINIQHLHDKTLTLPIHEQLQIHASQSKRKTQHPPHPLHNHTTYFSGRYTTKIPTDPHTVTTTEIEKQHAPYTYIYCLLAYNHKRQ